MEEMRRRLEDLQRKVVGGRVPSVFTRKAVRLQGMDDIWCLARRGRSVSPSDVTEARNRFHSRSNKTDVITWTEDRQTITLILW